MADRSHLVANLRDALQQLLDSERQCLPELQERQGMASMEQEGQQEEAHRDAAEQVPLIRAEALPQTRRSKRYERYQAVIDLHQQGFGRRAIARETGLSRTTVRRYLEAGAFAEQGLGRKRPSLLDPYLPNL